MSNYHFCICVGVDGLTPMTQEYHAADDAAEALEIIRQEARAFVLDADNDAIEAPWETFFQRGAKAPDASMWNFTLAYGATGINLSLIGMTRDDYARESAE